MIDNIPLTNVIPMRGRAKAGKSDHRWDDIFGIELELENVRLNEDGRLGDFNYWAHHRDGSLLGGMELVLNPPREGVAIETALNEFYNFTGPYTGGLRTSTHIHINAGDMSVGQLRSVILFTYAIENPLFRVVGESRKWCGYAMGLSEMTPKRFRNIMRASDPTAFATAIQAPRGGERYYGLNVASLYKHGSLEFRHFPGAPTREELESWLDFVKGLKRLAQAHPVPEITDAIETEDQLMEALRQHIPATILDKLLFVAMPNEIWTAFNEALAIINVDAVPDRLDQLITIPRPLVMYMVKSKTLNPIQGQKLAEYGAKMRMMTVRDFRNILNTVKNESPVKPKIKKTYPFDYRMREPLIDDLNPAAEAGPAPVQLRDYTAPYELFLAARIREQQRRR